MVVVCYIMGVSMIGMHHINDVLVGMAVIRDLGVMLGHDLCQFGDIVRDHAGIG